MTVSTDSQVAELTVQDAERIFDEATQRWLDMSGPEFLRRWDAGEFEGEDTLAVQQVAMLLPLARRDGS